MSAPRISPLAGPFHQDPTTAVTVMARARMMPPESMANAMLKTALSDIERGGWDEQVISWLIAKDVSTIATMASLMRRCWEAGVVVGRAEIVDEQPAVRALRAEVDDLTDRMMRASVSLGYAGGELRDMTFERDETRDQLTHAIAAEQAYRSAAARATNALALVERAVEDAQTALDNRAASPWTDEGFDRQIIIEALIDAIRHAVASVRDEGGEP